MNNCQIYQQKRLLSNSEGRKTIKRSWSCSGGFANTMRGYGEKSKTLREKQKEHQCHTGLISLFLELRNLVRQKSELNWLTYRIFSLISKSIDCSSFFLIFTVVFDYFCYLLYFCFISFCCVLVYWVLSVYF